MLAAGSKVSTRDLMARMGHDSMTAALICQHASREADKSIIWMLPSRPLTTDNGPFMAHETRPRPSHIVRMWLAASIFPIT